MKKTSFYSITVLFCLLFNNLFGQTKNDTSSYVLKPLNITGSRLGKDFLKTPSSVNIITMSNAVNSNSVSFIDLVKNFEGIYTYDASGIGVSSTLNMRGFYGGMSSHQLVMIDGIPQNNGKDKLVNYNLIDIGDIEKIEIIKGPASTLYGNNALSGVINIITKRAGTENENRISLNYGSFNTQNYRFSSSGKLYNKFGYYLNLDRNSSDGYRKNSDYEKNHINGKINYLLNSTQDIGFAYDYNYIKTGAFPWPLSESDISQDRTMSRPGAENDQNIAKENKVNVIYRKFINDLSFIEAKAYFKNKDEETYYTETASFESTREQIEQERTYGLNLQGNFGGNILGMDNYISSGIDLEKVDMGYTEYKSPNRKRGSVTSDYDVTRTKIGPFIQDEINVILPLKLVLGLRYDMFKYNFTDLNDGENSKNITMSKLSPKVGLVYSYYGNSNIYANYAIAFRTPTLGDLFTYGIYSNPDLKPEEAANYEIGIRHKFNNIFSVNLSYYLMNMKDEIWFDYTPLKFKNYGETSHKGLEARIEFANIGNLYGAINYSYVQAKNESGPDDGKYLPNIPIHKGGLNISYFFDSGFVAGLNITKVGKSYLDESNSNELDGYTTVDINLAYKYKFCKIFATIQNLLSEKYYPYGYVSWNGQKFFNPVPDKAQFTLGLEIGF
jgi:iron complex outermembrane recepter protein